jgi:hypothetical protein
MRSARNIATFVGDLELTHPAGVEERPEAFSIPISAVAADKIDQA